MPRVFGIVVVKGAGFFPTRLWPSTKYTPEGFSNAIASPASNRHRLLGRSELGEPSVQRQI